MIFLSDGICEVSDTVIQDLCHSAVRLGYVISLLRKRRSITHFAQRNPLSFHSISFGPDASSAYLRRMYDVALGIQNTASQNSRTPVSTPSSFSFALDTVTNLLHLL